MAKIFIREVGVVGDQTVRPEKAAKPFRSSYWVWGSAVKLSQWGPA